MALRELSSLEKYLGLKKPNKYSTRGDKKFPVLQNNNGPPLMGLVTIARHLVKEAKCPELLGQTAKDRAVVHQWLEYRVSKLDGVSKDGSRSILKVDLTFQEKEQYMNVTRWFDHIQHRAGIRHHLPPVVVLKNNIYTHKHH
ncbi:eukaryotic translation elongation factor 1 epsilon-1 isoform X2 [Syngnathoides biaculeatus]|uniref:eukaryotic translation elongation factor 1 epsilon-1 isoform X2 n=1 Tax=Syngnathoides biaculeatus TaxID=300417 RepID=UPI002ADE5E6F|nr:eukaryotic translation elongation factor 1 epsilon-1 isoform X2 [Syngnathoides biaculeatus]